MFFFLIALKISPYSHRALPDRIVLGSANSATSIDRLVEAKVNEFWNCGFNSVTDQIRCRFPLFIKVGHIAFGKIMYVVLFLDLSCYDGLYLLNGDLGKWRSSILLPLPEPPLA